MEIPWPCIATAAWSPCVRERRGSAHRRADRPTLRVAIACGLGDHNVASRGDYWPRRLLGARRRSTARERAQGRRTLRGDRVWRDRRTASRRWETMMAARSSSWATSTRTRVSTRRRTRVPTWRAARVTPCVCTQTAASSRGATPAATSATGLRQMPAAPWRSPRAIGTASRWATTAECVFGAPLEAVHRYPNHELPRSGATKKRTSSPLTTTTSALGLFR